MAGEIATAYVRIRPQMSAFKSETESGVRGAFSNIGKIVGGAFAAVGAFEFGKHIVDQAAGQQAAFAVLDRAITNAGASTRGFGSDLESVLAKEARLKGFSDEQLAGALTTLVSVTHNTRKAFDDLQIAEDLARARHKDLSVAALALARAEQGSTQTLSRFGIKVNEITTNVDRLKHAHDEAVASGAKFTGQTKLEYNALLAQAQASDKALTKQEALRLVTERFGGVAATFAKTAAGEFARFHENVNQLEIAIGKGLLPGLAGAAAGLNKYVSELSTSQGLQNAVRTGAHDIGQAFDFIKSIVEALGPPLLTVAHAGESVVSTLGAAPILAAVAAYKGIGIAVNLAAKAEQGYANIINVGRAAKTTETAQADTQVGVFTRLNAAINGVAVSRQRDTIASTEHATALERENVAAGSITAAAGASTGGITAMTGALEANTAAATADAAAVEGLVTVYGPLGGILATVGPEAETAAAGLTGLAAAETEVAGAGAAASAGGFGAFVTGIGRLGLGAVGGPVGAAVLGIAALAGGIVYLGTRESETERATKNLEKAFLDLSNSQDAAKQSSIDLASAHAAIGSDKTAISQAKANVETARSALASSSAAKGTSEHARLVSNLNGALIAEQQAAIQLRSDLLRLSSAEQDNAKAVAAQSANTKKALDTTSALAKASANDARTTFLNQSESIKSLQLAIATLTVARNEAIRSGQKFTQSEALSNLQAQLSTLQSKQQAAAVDSFTRSLSAAIPKLAQQSPLVAHNTELLLEYTQQVGRIPSTKVTNVILATPNLNATLAEIDAKLKSLDPQAFADGQAIGVAWGTGILSGIKGAIGSPLATSFDNLGGPLGDVSRKIQDKVRAALATGIFTPDQIAKQFGISPAQVSAIEKQATDASAAAASKAKAAADKAGAKPKSIANIIPFKVQLELAGAVTQAQQRKALEDEIAALNKELSGNITESTRRAIELEKASVEAQLAGLVATVAQSGNTVANTIATAHAAIEKSVSDAKTNLDKIGAALGASIDKFLGKGGVGGLDTAQSAAFAKLKGLLSSGANRFEIERAAAALNSDLTSKAGQSASTAKDEIKGFTDAFNSGKISLKTFNKDVTNLLKADHISYSEAGKLLGRSFEDGLRSQVQGLSKQASAIAAVPKQFRGAGGAGDVIKIIRPLEVIQHENALIRAANDRHAAQAASQRERIIRASERTAKAVEAQAATAKAAAAVKKAMLDGKKSTQAKHAAKAGVKP